MSSPSLEIRVDFEIREGSLGLYRLSLSTVGVVRRGERMSLLLHQLGCEWLGMGRTKDASSAYLLVQRLSP